MISFPKTARVVCAVGTVVMLLGATTPAFADDTTPTAVPTPVAQTSPLPGQGIRQQFRKEMQTLQETRRSERAKFHATRLERNFGFYALRLNNITTRIQSLIDKRKAAGRDVTEAQKQLDTGKATLQQAVADGQKAVAMFNAITVDVWDVQKPEVKAAITQAQLARKEFVTSRIQMVQTVKLLRK